MLFPAVITQWYTGCFFYRVLMQSTFVAYKACICRDILCGMRCPEQR